ncbi:hypothetical protein WJX72_006612 [[Myrmecia] bisecta]|uniref:TLC domain-containing protein n=1 Tax=[Myrmecia] bisecta TaxID=41462 RepID=A0AAW1PGF7_9CHLO
MRIISTLHAVVLVIGSLWCFADARGYDESGCIWGYSFPPDFMARVFLGYLLYDLALMIRHHRTLRDTSGIIHHLIFACTAAYVLAHSIYKYPFSWLSLAELSTPFINLRWHLAVTGYKDSKIYLYNGLLVLGLFFFARVLVYGIGLAHLWRIRHVWLQPWVPAGHKAVAGLLTAGYLLNVYWMYLMVKAVRRALSRKKEA